jgi:thioredoxin 1
MQNDRADPRGGRPFAPGPRVAKLDVDANSATAAKFNIRSIPTLLLFKKGALIAQKVGAVSQSHLVAFLEGHLRDDAA